MFMRTAPSLPAARLAGVSAGLLALSLAPSALAQLRLLSDGPQVEFRDMVARVVVTPEDRSDVDIRVHYGKAKVPTLMVSRKGNVTTLNGHVPNAQRSRTINLRFDVNFADTATLTGRSSVNVNGVGDVAINDLPTVYVRVPQNAVIKDSATTFGAIGPAASLDFILNGPGEWTVASVSGPLNIIDSGAGNIHVGSAGDAIIDNLGAGDIDIGATRKLKVSLIGSGNFSVTSATDTEVQSQGSGAVSLGHVQSLKASLNGSGNLAVQTIGGGFTLSNNGSSDVGVDRVNGPVVLDMAGSGDVKLRAGQAQSFVVRGSGSGDVQFGGVAGTVNIDSNGSGDVNITRATGAVVTRVSGSGAMHVGH
jgi:hypothetical protein